MKLGEVLFYEQPTKYIVESELYNQNHKTPVLTAGKSFILGYTNETEDIYKNLPCIIFDDFTTSIQYVDFPFKVKSSAMKILTTNNKHDLKYLYYLLSTLKIDTRLHKRYWISIYAKLNIKLPPLPEQERIAAELDAVSGILAKQKEQEKLLNDLIKSKFHEMFGDPVLNDRGWDVKTIGETCILKSGNSLPENYEVKNGGIPYVKVGDMNLIDNEDYIVSSSRFVEKDKVKKQLFPIGCVIFPKRGGAIGTNKKRITACEICADLNIMGVIPQKEIDTYYLRYYFEFVDLGKLNNGSSVPQINNIDIYPLKIQVPPLPLQQQFADFVNQVEKSKEKLKTEIEQTETLYKALMQKYFGE